MADDVRLLGKTKAAIKKQLKALGLIAARQKKEKKQKREKAEKERGKEKKDKSKKNKEKSKSKSKTKEKSNSASSKKSTIDPVLKTAIATRAETARELDSAAFEWFVERLRQCATQSAQDDQFIVVPEEVGVCMPM